MKILLVGASGTLGRAIAAELGTRHEIIRAGRKNADVAIDIADPVSIKKAFSQVGKLDAVICAAGHVNFAPLSEFDVGTIAESKYGLGLTDKLLGQVNLALAARDSLRDGGSITLITGFLSQEVIAAGSSATMVNCAVEGFVRAAAIELPRGIRINAVSPAVFAESMKDYGPFFRGFEPIPVARAALAFVRSVEGLQTGQIYRVM